MAKTFQFDDFEGSRKTKTPHCIACEEMLADALDESLGEVDQAWFERHVSTCGDCNQMLADAQRGAAWLEMLKTPRPEPSARLMERILAQTSGLPSGLSSGQTVHQPQMVPTSAPMVMPVAVPVNLLQFRPRMPRFASWGTAMFEPRLAMTAAMAFFSIALTLNLTGVQLNQLHVSDLKPANLKHSYYEANAEAVRFYDNLRVVRVMESRVEDLRQANTDDSPAPEAQPKTGPEAKPGAPAAKPEEKKKPEGGPGVSMREAPAARPQLVMTDDKSYRGGQPVAGLKKMHDEGGLV